MITLPNQAAREAVPADHPFNLPGDTLLSQGEASAFIAAHGGSAQPSSLATWASRGKGPRIVRAASRRVFYRADDLRTWLASQMPEDTRALPEEAASPASEAYVEKLLERIECLEVYAHELREECRRRRLENAGLKDRIAALMGEARAEGPALQD